MTAHHEERIALQEALRDFASSPRFHFLKTLQVGPLLGDDAKTLGTISEMSFEQLVSSLDSSSSAISRLAPAQERMLTAVLRALAERESSEVVASATDDELQSREESSRSTFTSVQCELDLRERVTKLRSHPEVDRVKHLVLGELWDEESPRAPFEESFTVGQLLGLDLAVLMKKRSMTSTRINAIGRALERALGRLTGEVVDVPAVLPPESRPEIRPPAARSVRHRWAGTYDGCSPLHQALVESVIRGCSDEERHAEDIRGALHHFCAVFSVADFLRVFGGDEVSAATERKLRAWTNGPSLRKISAVIRLALRGPGIHLSSITSLLSPSETPHAFHGVAAVLLLRGLGAERVCVEGQECSEVWSTNPRLASLLVERARARRRGSAAQMLAEECPDMDPFLHTWLQGIVSATKKGKNGRK